MIQYVIDSSVLLKWFVDEEHSETARRLQEDEYDLIAPDLILPESGNILWKKVQRRELTPAEARLVLKGIERQPINVFPSELVVESALEIAVDAGRTVYDSCYIALAMLNACLVITADQRLANSLKGSRYNQYVIKLADLP